MESAIDHPCQASPTGRRWTSSASRDGGKFVLSWACHPRALPLAVPPRRCTWPRCAAWTSSTCARPGFELPPAVMEKARARRPCRAARRARRRTAREAMEGAHVIYAKSWSSTRHYGDKPATRRCARSSSHWCVDEPWFATARPDCRFMHCLPVRRSVVVADRILDGPRSAVIQGARNRMCVQMAVLYRMLKG